MMALDAPETRVEELFSDVITCTLPEDREGQERWGDLSVTVDEENTGIVVLTVSSEGAHVYIEITSAQAAALGSALL
jgi:hypothetical protein